MTSAKYSFQGMNESMAKAMKRDVELSFKVAIEISSFLKGKSTSEAKIILDRVLDMTQAIPYKRFNKGVGHVAGSGIAAGRFPQKGSAIFIELIKSAEANAQAKGLSSELKIIHLAAQKSAGAMHSGRTGRKKFKRCHLEIVVKEQEKEKEKDSKKPAVKKTQKPKQKEELNKADASNHKESKEEESQTESKEESQKETVPKKKRATKTVQEDKQ
jgi:ribosomal protein uL22